MPRILSDPEIQRLLAEPKPIPSDWEARLKPIFGDDSFQGRCSWKVAGDDGAQFRVDVRQSGLNRLDFSIILTFIDDDKTEYILTRFNGKTPSEHTNRIEWKSGDQTARFRNRFHIHIATERYQIAGHKIESFAEITHRYASLESATYAFVHSNGFYDPEATDDPQLDLFDEE